MLDKFCIPEIVLGALFGAALTGGIWGWTDSYALTDRQKQECYEAAQKSGQKSDECKTFWERTTSDPVAFFTLVLAFSTIGLWVVTIGLYLAGERQFRLARKEFLSTHRPRIRIKHVWLMNEFWYDHPLNVKVVCVNCGTIDARIIDYGLDFLIIRKGASLPANHKFAFERAINMPLKSGISGTFPDLEQSIDEAAEVSVRNGQANFYCVGYLHYLDEANNPRTTAFCRQLILGQLRGGGHFLRIENPDYEYED
jgi:hypothetical protein